MTTSDPTRSPAGTESAWAYTHLPHGLGTTRRSWRSRSRMEAAVERVAPGFLDRVRARHVQAPADLEAADPNLVGGAINAGTAALHQQLVLRPTRGSVVPRPRSRASTWPARRPTPAAGCTAPAGGTPPESP